MTFRQRVAPMFCLPPSLPKWFLAVLLAIYIPRSTFSQTRTLTYKPKASLSLTISKDVITQGQCVIVTLAMDVALDNKVPIQFYNPGGQLQQFLRTGLIVDHCFRVDSNIDNVDGVKKQIDGDSVISYPFYRAGYCPSKAEDIRFPAFALKMLLYKTVDKSHPDTIAFRSAPRTVKVNPIPPTTRSTGGASVSGKFSIEERMPIKSPKAGEIFTYEIRLSGIGLLAPVTPPTLKLDGARVECWDIKDQYGFVHGAISSTKLFTYRIVFQKAGSYALKDKIMFNFYNPSSGKVDTLRTSAVVRVQDGGGGKAVGPFLSRNKFIAIDISQSMDISDYAPTRLQTVKDGLEKFLTQRKTCDVNIVAFEGKPWHLFHAGGDACDVKAIVDDVELGGRNPGTAIGDAIWLAQNSFTDNAPQKTLVLIGDGDNVGGLLSPRQALALAKNHNIRIFTIGIGKEGIVQYKAKNGQMLTVDNTFFDGDLKEIAAATGAKYYHAKDAQHIAAILAEVLK